MRPWLTLACLLTTAGCGVLSGSEDLFPRNDGRSGDAAAETDPLGAIDAPRADVVVDRAAPADAAVSTDGKVDALPDDAGTADGSDDAPALVGSAAACPNMPPLVSTNPSAACSVLVEQWDTEEANHAEAGPDGGYTEVPHCTRPPSSGTHYPEWAKYGTYTTPIPAGYLVHNLEHGAIVITYLCDGDCSATRDALELIVGSQNPTDGECERLGVHPGRYVLAPDPSLDVAVAAAAWTWTYQAACVDQPSLQAFMTDHYGNGPENLCNDGSYAP